LIVLDRKPPARPLAGGADCNLDSTGCLILIAFDSGVTRRPRQLYVDM